MDKELLHKNFEAACPKKWKFGAEQKSGSGSP